MNEQIQKLYSINELRLGQKFNAGNCNESYLLLSNSDKYVLRIINTDQMKMERILSIQEIAAQETKLIAQPIRSINNRFIENICMPNSSDQLVSITRYIEGETNEILEEGYLQNDICLVVGKNLALLHTALARENVHSEGILKWYEGDNCFNIKETDYDNKDPLIDIYKEKKTFCIMNYQNLQMIHGDIHFDNIIIGKSNTFFCDFDDVCIGDYRMDLALLLFDLAIISTPIGDWSTINKYANGILKGYNENSNHPNVEFDDLEPLFKLLEINFYIEFRTLESTDLEDGWIKRFLINRRDSVESKKVFWRRPT